MAEDQITFNNLAVNDALEIPSTNAGETNSLRWNDAYNKLEVYDDKRWQSLATEKFVKSDFPKTYFTRTGTIYVGPTREFKSIQAAWNHIRYKTTARWITIKVDDGFYETSDIVLNHVQGRNVKIVGNVANPERCVIKFKKDSRGYSHGIRVYNQSIYFEGFNIQGAVSKTHTTHRAIYLVDSTMYIKDNTVIIDNTFNGIEVREGSKLYANRLKLREVVREQIIVTDRSHVLANYIDIHRSTKSYTHRNERSYNSNTGFHISNSSSVISHRGRSENMAHHAYMTRNCQGDFHRSTVTAARSVAFVAYWNSMLAASYSVVINSREGYRAGYDSSLYCPHSQFNGGSHMAVRSYYKSLVDAADMKIDSSSSDYGFYAHESGFIAAFRTKSNNNAKKPYSSTNGTLHHTNSIVRYS